jgi:UDP-N-acetylmuramate--alanine ligase
VLNATAAVAIGRQLDVSEANIFEGLRRFRGVDRRFQLRGQARGINVVDDYGHHPTEIRATLAAARQCGFRRIHVVFQPHRYTRTRDLMDDFVTAFTYADSVYLLDIYAASEKAIEGVTAKALTGRINQGGKRNAQYMPSFSEATDAVIAQAQSGDLILTMGAGNVSQLGPLIVEKLGSRTR